MKRNRLLPCAALYAISYGIVYKLFLFPTYEYMKFALWPHGIISHSLSLGIAVVPVFFYRGFRKISSYVSIWIYAVCYVPTILTLLFALKRSLYEILALQLCFMAGMSLLFLADRVNVVWMPERPGRLPITVLHVFTLVCTLIVVLTYLGNMKLVSFENVYVHRFANIEIRMAFFVNYMVMWLASCLYPLYFAIGIARKKIAYALAACGGHVLIYMCTASKLSLLTPVIITGAYLVLRFGRKRAFSSLLAGVIGLSAVLLFVAPRTNALVSGTKSLLFMRTLGTPGWSNSVYYDYFQRHGYTYYTHVNLVNFVTKGYPYGSLSLGQVIGRGALQSDDANFNANFWATDGIAAGGIPGVLFISGIVFLFLTFVNSVFKNLNLYFGALCITSFAMNLLNISFFTSLLSGGGLLLLLIVRYVRLEFWRPVGCDPPGVS